MISGHTCKQFYHFKKSERYNEDSNDSGERRRDKKLGEEKQFKDSVKSNLYNRVRKIQRKQERYYEFT